MLTGACDPMLAQCLEVEVSNTRSSSLDGQELPDGQEFIESYIMSME